MVDIKPMENETLEQYKYRLYSSKKEYGHSWNDIASLIKKHFGKTLSKDYVRHESYGMVQRDKVKKQIDDEYTKVLVINDLHLPYVRDDIFDVIEKNKNVDYIIIGGDLADCKSCSSFDAFDKPSLEEELVIVHEFISKVNTIINPEHTQIIAIRGNHEFRLTRDIMKLQEKHLAKMLNPKMLDMIAKGFTYYEKNKDIHYKPISNFTYHDDWFIRLFDNLIVGHPLDFSCVEGTMCLKVADYFLNEHIAEKDDVVIFAHTHKHAQMKVNRRQGVFVIENGCLCQEQEYSKTGKMSYTPQNYGYTVAKFKEGQKINLNDIRFVHLD